MSPEATAQVAAQYWGSPRCPATSQELWWHSCSVGITCLRGGVVPGDKKCMWGSSKDPSVRLEALSLLGPPCSSSPLFLLLTAGRVAGGESAGVGHLSVDFLQWWPSQPWWHQGPGRLSRLFLLLVIKPGCIGKATVVDTVDCMPDVPCSSCPLLSDPCLGWHLPQSKCNSSALLVWPMGQGGGLLGVSVLLFAFVLLAFE